MTGASRAGSEPPSQRGVKRKIGHHQPGDDRCGGREEGAFAEGLGTPVTPQSRAGPSSGHTSEDGRNKDRQAWTGFGELEEDEVETPRPWRKAWRAARSNPAPQQSNREMDLPLVAFQETALGGESGEFEEYKVLGGAGSCQGSQLHGGKERSVFRVPVRHGAEDGGAVRDDEEGDESDESSKVFPVPSNRGDVGITGSSRARSLDQGEQEESDGNSFPGGKQKNPLSPPPGSGQAALDPPPLRGMGAFQASQPEENERALVPFKHGESGHGGPGRALSHARTRIEEIEDEGSPLVQRRLDLSGPPRAALPRPSSPLGGLGPDGSCRGDAGRASVPSYKAPVASGISGRSKWPPALTGRENSDEDSSPPVYRRRGLSQPPRDGRATPSSPRPRGLGAGGCRQFDSGRASVGPRGSIRPPFTALTGIEDSSDEDGDSCLPIRERRAGARAQPPRSGQATPSSPRRQEIVGERRGQPWDSALARRGRRQSPLPPRPGQATPPSPGTSGEHGKGQRGIGGLGVDRGDREQSRRVSSPVRPPRSASPPSRRGLTLARDDPRSGHQGLGEDPPFDLEAILSMNEEALRLRGLDRERSGNLRVQARVQYRVGSRRGGRGAASLIDDEARCADWESGDLDAERTEDESEDEEEDEEQGGALLSESERRTRHAWRRTCRRINGGLLRGDAAGRMEAQGMAPRQPGEPGYVGIGVDETNNCDMARTWETQFQPSAGRGVRATYTHLKITLGQFSRLSVCLNLVPVRDLWRPGSLFRLLINRNVVRIFLSYFRLRGQPTTVSNKAANLKLAVRHAAFYFSSVQDSLNESKANEMQVYIGEYRAAERREIRRTSRTTPEDRFMRGKMLEESDMNVFEKMALFKCHGIMETVLGNNREVSDLFTSGHAGPQILRKWALNFMVYLLFASCGQRPQVFCSLLVPEE
jgi:hypothetical protein